MNKSASPINPEQQKTEIHKTLPEYKSNPFAVSFKGFELLVVYAKGVFIALIVLGIFGLIGNFAQVFMGDGPQTTSNTESCVERVNGYCVDEEGLSEPSEDFNINAGQVVLIAAIVVGLLAVAVVVGAAIGAVIAGTVAAGAVSAINKKHITFGRAIGAMGDRFGVLFVAQLLVVLRVIGGYLLFIIPGIRAQFRYEAVPYIVMSNPKMTAKESLTEAKTLYNGHLMEMFGITFVEGLIPVVGSAFGAGGKAMSYSQLKAYHAASIPTPKTHWLNYLPFIVVIVLSLLFTLLAFVLISSGIS